MHSLSVIQEIVRLLDEGELSQRAIASKLGVSRGTVSAVSNGSRGIWGKPVEEDKKPPGRCKRCGYRVAMPCQICQTREFCRRTRVGSGGQGRGFGSRESAKI